MPFFLLFHGSLENLYFCRKILKAMATLGEIMNDPSKATEEDINAMRDIFDKLNLLKNNLKPYEGVTVSSGRPIKEIAIRFYQENLILSAILEAFVYKEKYYFADLNKWVFDYIDKDFIWEISIPYYNRCVAKLCNTGLLKAEFSDNKDVKEISITEEGKSALRQQTYANLAQSSLFNYQASLSNEESVKLNRQIKKITIMSVIVSVLALAVAIIALLW